MLPRIHTLPVPNPGDTPGTHDLVFSDWGEVDAKQAVICVHGLTRNAHDFDALAPALAAKGRRVFSLNMAGRGMSAWLDDPMQYNYGTYVTDCLAVMNNFHLRQVEWVGTSMGGIIGMTIATHHPERIRKLVLNDIGSFLSRIALTRIYDYVRSMPSRFHTRDEAEMYLAETFQPFGITDPDQWAQFVKSSLLAQRDSTFIYACDPAIAVPIRAASNDFTEIQDINLIDIWQDLTLPTLVIHGEQSDILTQDTIDRMRRTNPRMESVTIPNVGHAPALMNVTQIRLVANWLAGGATSMMASGL